MEENITQRRTNTISVTLYCQAPAANIAEELSSYIAPDGKEAREFDFRAASLDTIDDAKYPGDLTIIAADEETAEKAARQLDKAGICHIAVHCTADNFEESCKHTIAEMEKALDMGFSIDDYVQIHGMGIPMEKIRSQLTIFRNGISKIVLEKPATIGDGIYPLTKNDAQEMAAYFDTQKDNYSLKKFVPASGAASRMFKSLCEFMAEYDPEKESLNAYMNSKKDNSLKVFLVGIDKFPFFKEILEETKRNPEYSSWSKDFRYYNFIKTMLAPGKFDFANKPKGILPFHQYDDFIATPIYEHLKECVSYASSQGKSHVHFTISEEHLDSFIDCIEDVKADVEQQSGVKIDCSFSNQQKNTDTIAVDLNNKPFRDEKGKLLFRPGGHGALIENLNKMESDIVCIKNIDNVSHNNIKTITLYKKALLGILVKLREQVFGYLKELDNAEVSEELINEVFEFAKSKLFINISRDVVKFTTSNKVEYARQLLDKPLRVCGMVKNEGEPGGGPFWVNDNGRLSLQIVESSQIDLDNKNQNKIFSASTHFNPVDLVCSLKNHKGEHFDLPKYVDPATGFIVYKNKMGRDVKSYELPGLWNGAMAEWITVFVEVPLETFNPVKTVNDLLKPAHQPH